MYILKMYKKNYFGGMIKESFILTNAFATIDWVSMVTKNTVFTVRTLGKVGTRLVTDTAIDRARAMAITLASWWTEVPYKLMICK